MTSCDLMITNATLIDGTGGPATTGDLAVTGDRIAAIGDLSGWRAEETIDGTGLTLAPGFIDAHTHDDRIVLADPAMAMKVSQGVTTVVTGNCGISLAPLRLADQPPPPLDLLGGRDHYLFASFADYARALDDNPAAVNVVPQVGHATLRVAAMGSDLARPATGAEIDVMANSLEQSMAEGAVGLSTGLAYAPAFHAPTEEIIALVARVAARGGIHTTHMRDEADHIDQSIAETTRIGREAGAPVVISHHKCCGQDNWGRSEETLAMIAAAQAAGQRLDLDVYPYPASSTVLEPSMVARSSKVLVAWSHPHPEMAGRDLDAVTREWGVDRDAAIDRLQPAGAIYFQMDEGDLRRIIQFPGAMIGSDGLPHDAVPHPRLWGSFPRVLGHYARDEGVLSLEEAVHRMTGKTASVFGLRDRGVLREGAFADLTLFDAAIIIDTATFENPTTPAKGIHRVITNGGTVWQDGASTGTRPGRRLTRAV